MAANCCFNCRLLLYLTSVNAFTAVILQFHGQGVKPGVLEQTGLLHTVNNNVPLLSQCRILNVTEVCGGVGPTLPENAAQQLSLQIS